MTTYRKLAAVLFAGSLVLAAWAMMTTTTDRNNRGRNDGGTSHEAPVDRGSVDRGTADRGTVTEAPPPRLRRGRGDRRFGHRCSAGQRREVQHSGRHDRRDDPLTGEPEKKTIAWLECELPTCPYITPGYRGSDRGARLGTQDDPSKSTDPGPAFQQAIDEGVDYIASSGEAVALYQAQPTPPTRQASGS